MTVISPRTEEPFRQLFRDTIISRAGRQRPSTSTAPGSLCRLLRRSAADKKGARAAAVETALQIALQVR